MVGVVAIGRGGVVVIVVADGGRSTTLVVTVAVGKACSDTINTIGKC